MRSNISWRAVLVFSLAAAILGLWAGPAQAAGTFTWTGGGANSNYNTAANWSGSVPAADLNNDIFNFNSSSPQTTCNFTGITNPNLQSFNFGAGLTVPMTITGDGMQFEISGNNTTYFILNNSSYLQTINNPVSLFHNGTIDAFAGDLLLGSYVAYRQDQTTAITLTLQGSHNGIISGGVAHINGTGADKLTKAGTGTWTLNGASTYTGTTTVNAGSLLVNGSLASGSAVTVNNGGTLGGTGTIGGTVTVASGGHFAPGAGLGMLTVGTTSLTKNVGVTGGVWDIEINSITGLADELYVNGNLTWSGTQTLNFTNLAGTPSGTYTFAEWTGTGSSLGTWNVGATASTENHWIGGTDLLWDTKANWNPDSVPGGSVALGSSGKTLELTVSQNDAPAVNSTIFIDPDADVVVTGPASSGKQTVKNLTIGKGTGVNTAALVLQTGGNLTVTGTTTVRGDGTLTAADAGLISPILNVNGGSATLGNASGAITTANVSAGTLTVNAGTVSTAVLTGTGSLAGTQAVTQVNVTGGTPSFSGNATTMTLTGGTVSFGANAKVATLDLSNPGSGAANAATPVAITSALKLAGGFTATLTDADSFTAAGANLADNNVARTLSLSGGTLAVSVPSIIDLRSLASGSNVPADNSGNQGTYIKASSYYKDDGRAPWHVSDWSGMTGTFPTATAISTTPAHTMWLSNGFTGAGTYISWNLNQSYAINKIHIWNYNEVSGSLTGRGVKSLTLETSTDGSTWTAVPGLSSTIDWTNIGSNGTISGTVQAPVGGSTTYAGFDWTLPFAITTQYLRFNNTQNFGTSDAYTGLSEVVFYQAAGVNLPMTTIAATSGMSTLDTSGGAATLGGLAIKGGSLAIGTLSAPTDLTMVDGFTYRWEYNGTGNKVAVTGDLTLAGAWTLDLGGAATPTAGVKYDLFTYDTFLGTLAAPTIDKSDVPGWLTPTITKEAGRIYMTFGAIGDTNGDNVVDAADYITLKQNFGRTDATLGAEQGDFDKNGNVDWIDLQTLMANFGTRSTGEAPAAPEPGSVMLLMFGAAAMLRRRRAD